MPTLDKISMNLTIHFVFEECGAKYKTKPGLSYHLAKAHANGLVANSSQKPYTDIPNTDENTTNSLIEANYDEMNSLSNNQ
jgi:hypothetical protein